MDDEEVTAFEEVLRLAKDGWDDLTDWEQNFMVSVEEQFENYGLRTRFSPNQWKVIHRVWEKLRAT